MIDWKRRTAELVAKVAILTAARDAAFIAGYIRAGGNRDDGFRELGTYREQLNATRATSKAPEVGARRVHAN